ncbi:MAG TPA: EamA family transporter [Candidatus Limnocylindrales bacterium]|nr:EamA family transporter [Candidatus Limnocylindrales bacterium]
MDWILLALLASAMAGAATIANKYVFVRVSSHAMVQTIAGGLVGILLSGLISVVYGFGTLSGTNILIAICSGIFFGLSLMLILYAIRLGNVSRVGPLRFLTPIFVTLLAAIFLNETLQLQTYAGIFLILLGAIFMENAKLSTLRLDKFLTYMLASCLMLATSQVLSKYLLRFSDPVTILVYVRVGLLIFILPLLAVYWKTLVQAIKPSPLRNTLLLTIGGIFGTTAMLLVIYAAAKGPISAVSTLASLAPFFILLYVIPMSKRFPDIYLDKTNTKHLVRKALLTLVMFAGVTLIIL